MFIATKLSSVNAPADVPPGVYGCECHVYAGPASPEAAFFFEYRPELGSEAVAVDLLIVDSAGAMRGVDFVWLSDRSWRDSSGVRANHLAELLPDELSSYHLVRTQTLAPYANEAQEVQ